MNESKKAFIIIAVSVLVFSGVLYFGKQKINGENVFKKETWSNIFTKQNATTKETDNKDNEASPSSSPNFSKSNLPEAIFNSYGRIKEIKKDSIVIMGSGDNFSDQKSRELVLKYISDTRTNSKDRLQHWIGFEGLKQLKIGEEITFESPQNIKEKTDFEVSYVNKL